MKLDRDTSEGPIMTRVVLASDRRIKKRFPERLGGLQNIAIIEKLQIINAIPANRLI
jgi:hypothetical protein